MPSTAGHVTPPELDGWPDGCTCAPFAGSSPPNSHPSIRLHHAVFAGFRPNANHGRTIPLHHNRCATTPIDRPDGGEHVASTGAGTASPNEPTPGTDTSTVIAVAAA